MRQGPTGAPSLWCTCVQTPQLDAWEGVAETEVIMASAYQSFPRTCPSAPSQAQGSPHSSSWTPSALSSTAEHIKQKLPPGFEDGRRASEERLRLLMGRRPYQPQRSQAEQQQQVARPPYPTEISFCSSSRDDVQVMRPFDGNGYGPPLGLDRMSLEDSFGFDGVSGRGSDGKGSDTEFERLFEQETLSSVELNPYSAKKMADSGMVAPRMDGKKTAQGGTQQQSSLIGRRCSPQSRRPSQDIFRQHPPAQQIRRDSPASPARSTPTKRPASPGNIISPTLAMERRHSSRPKSRPRHSLPPTSPQNGSIRRSNTHGTPSPQNRSRSSNKARSRSRSQSARPARLKEDDYHASLFAGAALIREQLLRSMASADEAMDEAEREFMEAMIERGGRQEDLMEKRRRTKEQPRRNMGEDDEFDTDYSRGINGLCRASYQSRQLQQPPRGASRDDHSTGLGSEGRRLDDLVRVFSANISTTASSEKENQARAASTSQLPLPAVVTPTSLESPGGMPPYFSQQPFRSASDSHVDPRLKAACSKDEALAHAQRAGPLWRSLVGQHVRFPRSWEGLLPPSSPQLDEDMCWSRWFYVARHRVKGDRRLNHPQIGVKSRRSGGRILLHLSIRDTFEGQVSREIAVGCFHPNSRGVRRGEPDPSTEDVREVYMAVRWVVNEGGDGLPSLDLERDDYSAMIDSFLTQGKTRLDYKTQGSAIGHRKACTNENVKAILGDSPVTKKVELHEDELAEMLSAHGGELSRLPALLLLKLFLYQ